MFVLNFSHPFSEAQIDQLGELVNYQGFEIETFRVQIDFNRSLVEQAIEIVDSVDWTPDDWQHNEFLVRPSSVDAATLAIMAEIHGRCGYFPPIVTMRRGATMPPTFDVWEVVDLQRVRNAARTLRSGGER